MADDTIIDRADRAGSESKRNFELLPGTHFRPEPIRWLWPQWLALGKLQLLAGSAGTGKTTISVALAAAVTTGAAWPDGGRSEVGDVLFWSGEDGIADTLVPRFLAAGGDLSRLHFAGDVTEGRRRRAFDPAEDLPKLIAAVSEMPNLRLVVLDPVVSTLTGDSHKNSETRRGLQPIVDMAAALDVAVIGITHLSKGTRGREPLERVVGSLAFGAVARVVLATVKARDPRQPHRLIRAKSNLGLDHGGIEYTLSGAPVPGHAFHAQRIDWGQRLHGSALALMSIETDEEDTAKDEAAAFLADLLAGGPLSAREIRAAALANGHTWRTVERAKADLGVTATRGPNGWYWSFPAEAAPAGDDEDRRQTESGGLGGEAPAAQANPATPDQDRQLQDGGGLHLGASPEQEELQFQISDLEDSITRQREQVRTLAGLQYRTDGLQKELGEMEERLERLKKGLI